MIRIITGRQHLRQYGVLEPIGKMLRLYMQRERSLGSQRNLAHAIVLYLRRYSTDAGLGRFLRKHTRS
jgi:hypothetical protein